MQRYAPYKGTGVHVLAKSSSCEAICSLFIALLAPSQGICDSGILAQNQERKTKPEADGATSSKCV